MIKNKLLAKLFCTGLVLGGLYLGTSPVMAATPSDTEPNDTKATATEVLANTEYSAALSDTKDVDYYKFVTDQDGYVTLSVDMDKRSEDYNTQKVYLYDAKLNELDSFVLNSSDQLTGTSAKIGLPEGTTVYAMVESTWGSPNSDNYPDGQTYTLTFNEKASSVWEKEFNEDTATATTMAVNTSYSGTLYKNGDKDYYKVVTNKNGYVNVSINMKNSSDYATLKVQLLDKNLNELETSETLATNGTSYPLSYTSSCVGLPANTTLYVLVEPAWGDPNGSEYTIKTTQTASSLWETEYNDTKANADSIALNKTYEGTCYNSDDVDYYKVNASVGTLDVSLRTNAANNQDKIGKGWAISILDKNMNVLNTTNDIKTKNSVSATITKAGTYYIKVSAATSWGTAPTGLIYDMRAMNVCQISYNKVSAPQINKSSFSVKWTKVSGATGYQIRYSTYSSMKSSKTVTISSGSTVTKKISGLKAKKKYYVQIRAFAKNVNKKTVYGSWSGKKTVTTK